MEQIPDKGHKQFNGAHMAREKSKGTLEKVSEQHNQGSRITKNLGHSTGPGERRVRKHEMGPLSGAIAESLGENQGPKRKQEMSPMHENDEEKVKMAHRWEVACECGRKKQGKVQDV